MLTSSSYVIAWTVYVASSVMVLLVLRLWWANWLRPTVRVTLLLLLAAALLTPAHPASDVASFAPALLCAAFALLTGSPEASLLALRPLLIMQVLALTVSAIFYLFTRKRGRVAKPAA